MNDFKEAWEPGMDNLANSENQQWLENQLAEIEAGLAAAEQNPTTTEADLEFLTEKAEDIRNKLAQLRGKE